MQSFRLAVLLLAACWTGNALAQTADVYPSRTIAMVVPVAPGTGADIIARAVAQKLSERVKQPVIVENKVGASGVIGADAVAKAPPNGYTLLLMLNSFTIVPSIYKSLPYDPVADFAPISRIVTSGYAFVVNPSAIPAKDLAQFVAQMKASPGKFSYATPGNGTAHHLAMELFKQQLGLDILHVPHKGFGEAINSTIGGHVQMMFAPTSAVLSQANSGKLRMLAVTGTQRSAIAPAVPTYRELGYDFMDDVDGWYALVAPAKTPAPIITKLHQELKSIMALPELKEGLAKQGLTAMSSSPQELDATIRSDLRRWAQLIKQAKIAAD